jgi:mannosyltransferase OCH1-like enzyme
MQIPRIVHQLWKDENVPARWRDAVASVKRYHKGWEYRLWTDPLIDDYVRTKHPRFYPVFAGMNRNIMRIDAFRYVLMHDIGGLYCDLDYEFVRPYDYGDASIVFSLEFDVTFGDPHDQVANFFFASVPGHPLWRDVLDNLQQHPPHAAESIDVCLVTGPWYLSGMYFQNQSRYEGVRLTSKPVFSPSRVHGGHERELYVNGGITYGFHHGWGSWKERLTFAYLREKLSKLARPEAALAAAARRHLQVPAPGSAPVAEIPSAHSDSAQKTNS